MQPEFKIPTVDELGQQPFNPHDLCPLATLNRRFYIDLPGINADWVGRIGWELCSRQTLVRLIQSRAAELGLADADPASLPQRLNTLLEGSTPTPAQRAALEVANEHGQRLGYLLASILLSPGGLTSPLVPWEAAYLNHWRSEVREITLGGGLASGRLGAHIRAAVANALAACGLGDRVVSLAAHPAFLPLIGAARSLGAGARRAAVVADFGGTRAKRGLAYYDDPGALQRLRVLPPVWIEALTGEGKTAELAAEMITILAETIAQVPAAAAPALQVICSLAAYVRDGQPARVAGRNMGTYSWLHQIAGTGSVTGWFSERLSAACGRPVQFQLAHDCDAAAHALAGRPRAAVLMLGNALGVGFIPPAGACRPLAAGFHLEVD